MKKQILSVTLCLLAVLFGGCPTGDGTDKQKPEPDPAPLDTTKTWARFTNNNEFSITVYSDRSRLSKLVDAEADSQSTLLEIEPNTNGAIFYPTWHILMEGVDILYEGEEFVHRVDAGRPQENPNAIPVPSLTELAETELSRSISGAVYLKIHNAGSSSLVLRRGSTEEFPQGAASSILNGGETGLYTVNPGPVSTYSIRKNTSIPVDFPAAMTDFVSGRFYSLRFDGNSLVVTADKKLSLAQAFAVSPPDALNARTLFNGNIALSWDRAGTETAYRLYKAEQSPDTFTFLAEAVECAYTDTAVTLGNTYYYKVSSIKKNIEGEKSAFYASATAEISALTAPVGLNASASGTTAVRLSWNPVNEAAAYAVYRGSSAADVSIYVASTPSTTYTVSGLSPGTGYYFTVCSVSANAESAPSSPVYGQTTAGQTTPGGEGTIPYPPAAPASLVVSSPASGSISLSWSASSTADSYNIYRSNTQSGAAAKIGTVTGTAYTDYASAGSSYYYSVTGVNSSGESAKSNVAFGFASSHYTLSYYSGAPVLSLYGQSKHYYRLPVTKDTYYTIEWQNGSGGDLGYNDFYVSAWQNDGTAIFRDAYNGKTSPKNFKATSNGYVTIEVKNNRGTTSSDNYQIYYY